MQKKKGRERERQKKKMKGRGSEWKGEANSTPQGKQDRRSVVVRSKRKTLAGRGMGWALEIGHDEAPRLHCKVLNWSLRQAPLPEDHCQTPTAGAAQRHDRNALEALLPQRRGSGESASACISPKPSDRAEGGQRRSASYVAAVVWSLTNAFQNPKACAAWAR